MNPIFGAAYVHLDTDTAWSGDEIGDEDSYQHADWPEGFVLIWATGDAIPVRETIARSVNDGQA